MVQKTWSAQGREDVQKGKLILGIDEAGRGCAIGPMVVGGVSVSEDIIPKLKAEGVRDSKAVTPAVREELAEKIRSLAAGVFIEEIPPSEIEERNLNLLEIQRIRRIISAANADVVYLDAPVAGQKGIEAFCQHIKRRLPGDCPRIIAENRADATYTVVGAASIIAKVRRDQIIADLRHQLGDFGSGYPSDEKTARFLRDCYEKTGCFPDCVRRRWLTVRRLTEPTQSFLSFPDEDPVMPAED
jgi:ribonuclease HII